LLNKIGDETRELRPIDISSYILADLYEQAKTMGNISKCVVTVPAYFTENQVAATGRAVELAGFKMDKTLNEPVAAAYAYQQTYGKGVDDTYLIIDFGGGTLDISMLEHEDGILEVKTYSGNNFLGGENVNDLLYYHFVNMLNKNNIKLETETMKLSLRSFVEKFKIALCDKQNENENEDCEYEKTFWLDGNKSYNFTLKTSEFNDVCKPVFDQVKEYINGKEEGIISKYKKTGGDIKNVSKVLFVGGSSRIPAIRMMVGDIFGKKKLDYSLNADTCVAEGAAYFSASCAGYLGDSGLHLVDAVPTPLGICVGEDQFVVILEADKAVPASGSQIFTTQYDNQSVVSIRVAQGFRFSFKDNNLLGQFNLQILKPGPRGVPQIEVTVHMDKDRNISVTAKDLNTGTKQDITFKSEDVSLSSEEISRMKADREKNAKHDEKLKERYEARQKLESYIYETRKSIESLGVDLKSEVEIHLNAAENWLKSEKESADGEEFKEELEKLKSVVESLVSPQEKGDIPMEDIPTKEDVREEL